MKPTNPLMVIMELIDFQNILLSLKALGLQQGATSHEIRNSYLRLVQQFHPDKNPNASDLETKSNASQFIAIKKAYNFLKQKNHLIVEMEKSPDFYGLVSKAANARKAIFSYSQVDAIES